MMKRLTGFSDVRVGALGTSRVTTTGLSLGTTALAFDLANLANPTVPVITDNGALTVPGTAVALTAAKLPSANLYQLFTYLRQRPTESGSEQTEGVLLYPHTTRDFAVDFTTHGHRIRARTLDLSQPWRNIHAGLMQIVADGSSH